MPINNNAVGAKLVSNPMFQKFISTIKSYPLGTVFTIRGCFTDFDWQSSDKSVRLSLGRLVKNNIDCGNIVGIECIPRNLTNNTQKYKVIGTISFLQKLLIPYEGVFSDYEILLDKLNTCVNSAVIYYKSTITNNSLDLKITCKKCGIPQTTLFTVHKITTLPSDLDINNRNTHALFSIWTSLVTLWTNELTLIQNNINNVYICSSNRSMLERCAGVIVDQPNNQNYEAIIQDLLNDFINGNKFALSINLKAISITSDIYKKFIANY